MQKTLKQKSNVTNPPIKNRRKHWSFIQFILDMHSNVSNVSWMRWMGTVVISNVMIMWTLACIFDGDWEVRMKLEDMPIGLLGIVTAILLGKVGSALSDKIGTDCEEKKVDKDE